MNDWVGVLHYGLGGLDIPKKELLLFDKVAVVCLEGALYVHRHPPHPHPEIADQLEWLEEQGLLIRTEGAPQSFYWGSGRQSDLQLIVALYEWEKALYERVFDGSGHATASPGNTADVQLAIKAGWARASLVARATADYLTSTRSVDAVSAEPIPETLDHLQAQLQNAHSPVALSDVAQVVLKALPLPSELTPIEDLIAFKQDPETGQRLLGLRIWMRDLAKARLPRAAGEEKLEWLLYEYQKHMELHRLKTGTGTLETVITTTLEIAENLVKIKWSKAAQALFSIRRRKLALLEAEASAPGREVSYVVGAKGKFTGGAE